MSAVYLFDARLVGFRGVRRSLALLGEQQLTDLHEALQAAFGWGDDHLYTFWLGGAFWAQDGSEYAHPWHAAEPDHLMPGEAPPRSAAISLDRLGLEAGQRIAYVFDFGDEWRVTLTLRAIGADDGGRYPRLVELVGDAPPQYEDAA
jgi:hypothetical protein